jgi:hypothetical protein
MNGLADTAGFAVPQALLSSIAAASLRFRQSVLSTGRSNTKILTITWNVI